MTGTESQKEEEAKQVKTLQRVKLHLQTKCEEEEGIAVVEAKAHEESFLNRGISFRVQKMMWFD